MSDLEELRGLTGVALGLTLIWGPQGLGWMLLLLFIILTLTIIASTRSRDGKTKR